MLAIGFPTSWRKGFIVYTVQPTGATDEPWAAGVARRICWVKMDMLRVDEVHGVGGSQHRSYWHASNVQTLFHPGRARREGCPCGRVAVICVQFQVQDMLFYGDWRKGGGQIYHPRSPAHCAAVSTPAHQRSLLSNSLLSDLGSAARGHSIDLNKIIISHHQVLCRRFHIYDRTYSLK